VLAVSLGRFAFSCATRCRSSADPRTLSRACVCVRACVCACMCVCAWRWLAAHVQTTHPAQFYYSSLYANDFGIDSDYKNATALITRMLPNALAGANYAPISCRIPGASCMAYLPETFKWIRALRAGTFTLPFTEDYIWQQPPGSQQMYTLVVGMLCHLDSCVLPVLSPAGAAITPWSYSSRKCLTWNFL
jgi:hypothetical protein